MADGTVKVEWTVDDQKMMAAHARQIQNLEKQNETLKQVKNSAEATGKAVSGIGESMAAATGHIARMVGGFSAMGAAVATVKAGLDAMQKKSFEDAQRLRTTEQVRGSLTEMAAGDPKMQKRFDAAKNLFISAGGGNEEQALRKTEQLAKAGELGSARVFAQVPGVDPGTIEMLKANGLQASTKGIIGMALGASTKNPTNISELLKATANLSQMANLRGGSIPEGMAAISAIEDQMGSPTAAADALNQGLGKLTKTGRFPGMGLAQIAKASGNASMKQMFSKQYLGEEPAKAFLALRQHLQDQAETLTLMQQNPEGLFDRTFQNRTPEEKSSRETRTNQDVRDSSHAAHVRGDFRNRLDDLNKERTESLMQINGEAMGSFRGEALAGYNNFMAYFRGPEAVVRSEMAAKPIGGAEMDTLPQARGQIGSLINALQQNTEAVGAGRKQINAAIE